MNILFNSNNQLRNLWWVVVFFLVLSALTFPMILISQKSGREVTIAQQAIVVVAATWICQWMSQRPMADLVGRWDRQTLLNLLLGLGAGAALMVVPALFLYLNGYVSWQPGTGDVLSVLSVTGMFIAVAVTEEFLFRGFVFQRLLAGVGVWGAQLLMSAYFLLIHLNNPGMTGPLKTLSCLNIFVASLLFGLAYLRTRSLVMPIAMHFMANWVQGALLGFGVSGHGEASILKPVFGPFSEALTGGTFGLEASIPGLLCVIIATGILYRWRDHDTLYRQIHPPIKKY